ncbi:MAG: ATP-binding protein [Terriglobales bacterium]
MLVLVWLAPAHLVTLLVYLPGIVISEALFGPWAGLGSVLVSIAGSGFYRIWYFPLQSPRHALPLHRTFAEESILLVVGLFIVWLMDQRTRSQHRVASSAQQLAAVMGNVSDAVVIFGSDFRLRSMNAAAQAMLDRDQPGESLIGERADELALRFQFTPADANVNTSLPASLEAASRAGITIDEKGTILDVGRNRRIEVVIHAIPWCRPTGGVEGSVVVITDLSAVKDLQLRLLDCARQAAIGKMFTGLSHDFNHALDIVRRALAVLDLHENASAEERRHYRDMIDRAAVDGSRIVRRLRDYLAGSDASTQVALSDVAQEAIEITRPLWRNRPALEVVQHLQPVPAVKGQRSDLERILVNLLFNAIDSIGTNPGRIVIQTESDAKHVRAWVEDNGPGIAPALLPRLFQAYYTTKPHGMGLGLFGASETAHQHGGTLQVTSDPHKGTRFTLEIPRDASH